MGWNGSETKGAKANRQPQRRSERTAPSPFNFKALVAGLIVIAGAGIALWMFGRSETSVPADEPEKKAMRIKAVTPASVPKAAQTEQKVVAAEPPPQKDEVKPYWDTNKWEMQNGYLVPKGARLVQNYLTNKVERVFKYSTDDTILAYLAPQPGGEIAPMQPIMGRSDEIFLKSLNEPVVINEEDSEKVREWKELVTVARAQIKERMDAGEKFADILQDHYKLMEENQRIRRDAQTELNKIYRDGDLEGAKKYKRVMDLALQQMGINELRDPSDNPKNRMKASQQ